MLNFTVEIITVKYFLMISMLLTGFFIFLINRYFKIFGHFFNNLPLNYLNTRFYKILL